MLNSLNEKQRNGVIGGIGLVLIGLLVFAAQLMQNQSIGWLITGGLALIFLVWGILTRQSGFFIPAGILGGVAVGLFLMLSTMGMFPSERSGAIMVGCLALGFASISLFSFLFTRIVHVWALIVAAILGFVAIALWAGGAALNLLQLAGTFWPLILVVIGISILWRVLRHQAA